MRKKRGGVIRRLKKHATRATARRDQTVCETFGLENAAGVGVFASASEKQSAIPDIKELHAKIGQQALEIDFLAGALGRMGDASAKR